MFPDPKQKEKAKRDIKYRMQYHTSREISNALDEMLECRRSGKLKKLIKIAERELGVHHQIKSNEMMPRKKEVAAEICNLIGLAHLDKLNLPQNYAQLSGLELLASILKVSLANKYAVVPYVFGDQKTYRDPGEPDTSFLEFKANIKRLENRLKYASMPIEKCHLWHEMGKQNLTQTKFDESRSFARKVIDEAHDAGSYLWEFLGRILVCRADVMQKNLIKINGSLKAAEKLVPTFENPDLADAISTAIEVRRVNNTAAKFNVLKSHFHFAGCRGIDVRRQHQKLRVKCHIC